jgi:uncharacterized damage-inducible protein DinB
MPKKSPWIERRFNFDLPIPMSPNVLERLRGTPARIEDRVRGVAPEVLRYRSGESWSIMENIGHLIHAETLWLLRLDDYEAGLETLRPAGGTNSSSQEENYNQAELGSLLAAFRRVRGQLVRRLESLDDEGAARTALHPRLNQPMRVLDMMVFIAEHDDHHLVRLTELLQASSGTT